jgi:Kae1-associated kinase Bud32
MKLIKQGAEAKLFLDKIDNQDVIIKNRIRKNYRIKQIDEKIRKSRTSLEYNLLTAAKRAGVHTPKIIEIDKKNHKIIMEYIDGKRVKEFLNESDKKTVEKVCFELGRLAGRLHKRGIIHGDLTTSNMILKDKDIYLIDFGLGFFSGKIEDQGTDLKLLLEALKSTHFKILDLCWESIMKGYKEEYENAEQVFKKMEDIQKRGRYMKR